MTSFLAAVLLMCCLFSAVQRGGVFGGEREGDCGSSGGEAHSLDAFAPRSGRVNVNGNRLRCARSTGLDHFLSLQQLLLENFRHLSPTPSPPSPAPTRAPGVAFGLCPGREPCGGRRERRTACCWTAPTSSPFCGSYDLNMNPPAVSGVLQT